MGAGMEKKEALIKKVNEQSVDLVMQEQGNELTTIANDQINQVEPEKKSGVESDKQASIEDGVPEELNEKAMMEKKRIDDADINQKLESLWAGARQQLKK